MELNKETINSNALASLRDQLLEKRALQQQAKAETDKAINDLKGLMSIYNEKYSEEINKFGINTSVLNSLDFERLTEDGAYWESVMQSVNTICEELYDKLKELLDV